MDDHRSTPGAPPPEGPNLDSLSARERELQDKIAQLKDYVEHAPERERKAQEDLLNTLPPPAEIQERERERRIRDQMTRGELKNEKRHQAKSGFLLSLLIIATLAIGLWIYQAVV